MTQSDVKILFNYYVPDINNYHHADADLNINGDDYYYDIPTGTGDGLFGGMYYLNIIGSMGGIVPDISSILDQTTYPAETRTSINSICRVDGASGYKTKWVVTINGPDEFGEYNLYVFGGMRHMNGSSIRPYMQLYLYLRNDWIITDIYNSGHIPYYSNLGGMSSSFDMNQNALSVSFIGQLYANVVYNNWGKEFLMWGKIKKSIGGAGGSQIGANSGNTLRITTTWMNIGDTDFDFRLFSGIGSGTPDAFDYYSGGYGYSTVITASPYDLKTTVIEVPLSVVPASITEFDVATAIASASSGTNPSTAYIFDIIIKDNKIKFGNDNVSIETIDLEIV